MSIYNRLRIRITITVNNNGFPEEPDPLIFNNLSKYSIFEFNFITAANVILFISPKFLKGLDSDLPSLLSSSEMLM